jgi:hypothetical protein
MLAEGVAATGHLLKQKTGHEGVTGHLLKQKTRQKQDLKSRFFEGCLRNPS